MDAEAIAEERKRFRQSPPGKPETPPRATRLDGLIPAYAYRGE